MPSPLRTLVTILLLVAAAPFVSAQSLREQVNAAIDRGVQHLIEKQLVDGSWYAAQPTYRAGMTGLALYALVECDVPPEHPAVLRACEYLFAIEPQRTYEVSVTMLAFAELAPKTVDEALRKRLDERLAKYTALLISYQDQQSGGYAYPDAHVDLSNTQYAAMALRAAALRGHEVPPKTWKGIAEYTIAMQEPASKTSVPLAGVRYTADREPTGSMTAAGVATLHICREQSKKPGNTWARHQAAALAWLAERFIVNDNPNASGAWHYYYLHTIERIGSMLGTSTIGTHDWYNEGATYLVGEQQGEGDWSGLENTAYALLFLKRATAPSTGGGEARRQKTYGTDDPLAPVSLRAFGDNPLRIWLSSFGAAELAEYGVDRPGGRALDVLVCEYWIDQGPGVVEPVVLARFEAPVTDARFAFEHQFERRGLYTLRAVLTLASPNEGRGPVILDSAPLEIDVRREDQAELLEIARGLSKNQLIGREVRIRASSWMDDNRDPRYLCDGILAVGWMSAVIDTDPFVSLAWNDFLECSELRIAHMQEPNGPESVLPRRVRVTLNGREEFEFEMPPTRLEVGVLVFDKKKKVRSLRIDFLESYQTEFGAIRPVGLGEIDIRAKKSDNRSDGDE